MGYFSNLIFTITSNGASSFSQLLCNSINARNSSSLIFNYFDTIRQLMPKNSDILVLLQPSLDILWICWYMINLFKNQFIVPDFIIPVKLTFSLPYQLPEVKKLCILIYRLQKVRSFDFHPSPPYC